MDKFHIDFSNLSVGGSIAIIAIAVTLGWIVTTFLKGLFGKYDK